MAVFLAGIADNLNSSNSNITKRGKQMITQNSYHDYAIVTQKKEGFIIGGGNYAIRIPIIFKKK